MSEFEYATGHQAGLVCPICGRVFAPWVPECTWHNPELTNMYTATQVDTSTKPEVGDGDYYKHLTK